MFHGTQSITINQQLHSLLLKLHQLGQELPQILIYLTQIVQPKLPQNLIIPFLGQMFEKLPPFLSETEPQKLSEIAAEPPSDAVPLKILLDLCNVQELLQQISVLQILHLTNNTIPQGTQEQQEGFLKKVQEAFQAWAIDTLKRYHSTLSETPLHLERQQLLQLEPQLPWEILQLLIELLKLPLEELFSFQAWLSKLPPQQIRILIQILQIETSTLLEIKRRIASSNPLLNSPSLPSSDSIPLVSSPLHSTSSGKRKRDSDDFSLRQELDLIGSGSFLDVEPLMIFPQEPLNQNNSQQNSVHHNTSESMSVDNNSHPQSNLHPSLLSELEMNSYVPRVTENYQIRIARQPPPKTVYQRILKPFPSVMLLSGQDNDANLFVEATLLRSDNETSLSQCIDGNRIVRISNGVFATFKKLKILSTSQQQGTLFRLKFTLKRYAGSAAAFEDIPNCSVISHPIEVFSHTQYLNDKQDTDVSAPPPPVVIEILPSTGSCSGGTRTCILGSNFINCPGLKVRFGDMVVPATFHEQGTLICVTPSRQRGRVPVSVTNDGLNFCETQSHFNFV
eukprot:CAMPEP_0174262348 /NCGR_PEP_ID=MMETSP0439-20130205/12922_1 /TAXON_ID=0 /ORGANISM="Stereomyxa ramosa, Strain Chinc5" /LENGTH=563 /DNA_ID=CAMNT_0015347043 /DNA_START=89 /DNA_END=1780 /DNA_ORIENTATION=-